MILAHPGSYSPFVLLHAGINFLAVKELEKASQLCTWGLLRSEIDSRITKDETLEDVYWGAVAFICEAVDIFLENEDEIETFKSHAKLVFDNFREWDQQTPRNYDQNWIRMHSLYACSDTTFETITDSEKEEIITQFYQELQNVESRTDVEVLEN